MKIRFTKEFTKIYSKLDPKIKIAVTKRLKLFSENSTNPVLNNHKLSGAYQKYRSINITGDWRAIYSEYKSKNGDLEIIFKNLGTHSMLYK